MTGNSQKAPILMLKGAEVILVPNACPMEPNRLSQLRSRAFENMVGIATANYAIGQPDCNGHSSAFDGIAYGKTSSGCIGPQDTLVVEAGEEEGVYLAIFPMKSCAPIAVMKSMETLTGIPKSIGF